VVRSLGKAAMDFPMQNKAFIDVGSHLRLDGQSGCTPQCRQNERITI
jgi:hypothetical protein